MNKNHIAALILVSAFFCHHAPAAQKHEKKFDSSGRIVQVLYYENSSLEYTENLEYEGDSRKPHRIIYEKIEALDSVPFKEIEYKYFGGNTSRIQFFNYKNGRRIEEGQIKYTYKNNRYSFIKYYQRLKPSNKLFMFALQQYVYSHSELQTRRFIQYEINPDSLKPMQSSQYLVNFTGNEGIELKSWVMDQASKKIIETKENNINLIKSFIEEFEKECITRSSGKSFNKI